MLSIALLVYRLLIKFPTCFILYPMDINTFLKILGDKVRAARKSKKISQEKLAEFSGLHPTYVSNIENGKVNASIYSYYALAKALEIPLSELLPMSTQKVDPKIESDVLELLVLMRSLNRKKQVIFLSAAKGLIAGIENTM